MFNWVERFSVRLDGYLTGRSMVFGSRYAYDLGKTADRLQSEHALFLLGKEYKLTHLGEEHLILKVLHQIKGR